MDAWTTDGQNISTTIQEKISSISSIQKNDTSLIKHSISVLEENVSGKILKGQNDQNETRQNLSGIRRDISKIQRGLTLIYGKKLFDKEDSS